MNTCQRNVVRFIHITHHTTFIVMFSMAHAIRCQSISMYKFTKINYISTNALTRSMNRRSSCSTYALKHNALILCLLVEMCVCVCVDRKYTVEKEIEEFKSKLWNASHWSCWHAINYSIKLISLLYASILTIIKIVYVWLITCHLHMTHGDNGSISIK